VIDVNTGRFTGSRSKTSAQRLEDTITKNNLEAVREVVRQLRLRDIGGIIVIDFIDMANPKNRALVEEALKTELERDRTKTYVVEISPLGLVEMTRQNVTEGPREILTERCAVCEGAGVAFSAASAAIDVERRLRALAASRPRSQAFRVELNDEVAAILVGPAAERLQAIEERVRRRFLLDPKPGVPLDHFTVVRQGKRADMLPEAPFAEGEEVELRLGEVGLRDVHSAVGELDGYEVNVADAARLVGKKVRVRLERILDGSAFATLVRPAPPAPPPLPVTAESEAEKPTRKPRQRKRAEATVETEAPTETAPAKPKPARKPRQRKRAGATVETEAPTEAAPAKPKPARKPRQRKPAEPAEVEVDAAEPAPEEEKPKRKTRRGSRGGRGRKRKPAAEEAVAGNGEAEGEGPRIHVPAVTPKAERPVRESGPGEGVRGNREVPPTEDKKPEADRPDEDEQRAASEEEQSPDGAVEPEPKPKRKTRRGSRGGRRRRKATVPGGGEESSLD
jgi:ribonuclease G